MNNPQPGPYPPQWSPQQYQPQPAAPQPYPQPQSYPQPQPYGQAPGGQYQPQQYGPPGEGIAVNTQYFPLGFMMAFFKPKVVIDGYETPPGGWGHRVIPVQPGRHQVHVHVPYFLPPQIGPADTVVDVYPGRFTELEYKAPLWGFSPGSLGIGPQKYNGVGAMIAISVVPLVLFVLMLLIVVASS